MNTIFEIFATILYILIILFPILVSGPVASLLFISYVKKKQLSIIHLVLLFVADGLSILIINAARYSRLPDLVFCLTPIAVAISWLILRLSWKTLLQIGEEDREFQKRMDMGMFLIFFLQIIIFLIAGSINPD